MAVLSNGEKRLGGGSLGAVFAHAGEVASSFDGGSVELRAGEGV